MILYNAASSYYSMVARFALLEANISFSNRLMDIHIAKEQLSPWYTALNPHMTVPTLVDGEEILTDSRLILSFASSGAGHLWLDADPQYQIEAEKIVQNFYAILIEDLTFAKAMIKFPPLHFLFPKLLGSIVRKLQTELMSSQNPEAVQAKIVLNENRIAYFTQGNLLEKLNIERNRVCLFLKSLPIPNSFLLGDKISSADIVVCIIFARLRMVGEYDLVEPFPELARWFSEMQKRPKFMAADIWQKFQLWRILLKR